MKMYDLEGRTRSLGILSENRLWLLKNSLTQKRSKKLCNRKPYKRRSRFGWTFSISQIPVVLAKQEFFNSHAC